MLTAAIPILVLSTGAWMTPSSDMHSDTSSVRMLRLLRIHQ